jgi:CotH kinase protein/Secretion system C-terminal sorting domain
MTSKNHKICLYFAFIKTHLIFEAMKIKLLFAALSIAWSYSSYSQTFTSSNLPILIVETNGGAIVDEPKITAKMKIINNGPGKRNNLTDNANDYDGYVGIEFRGSSSQSFPKKPYGFETRDDKGASATVSLLGFPKEQDWVLYPGYNEKTLIHNVMAMQMYRDLGSYASRTQHVEMVLNGKYEGVYLLMEKVKRDGNRVSVAKMTTADNSDDAVTGGYIFKIDKTTGSAQPLGWTSKIKPTESRTGQTINFFYDYPSPSNITPQQKAYLKTYVDSAEVALSASNFRDPVNGYQKFFGVNSFVRMFLINEVSKNIDGYRISTYFHKERHSKDRRIKAGPAWDYDIAFGNADYCSAERYQGWSYLFGSECPEDYWQVPFHWKRMLEDTTFSKELRGQYTAMRRGQWKTARLHFVIDSLAAYLDESQKRNFVRWPVLGVYVWPNPKPLPTTYQGEISNFKAWLAARLDWLDGYLFGTVTANPEESTLDNLSVEVSPNPFGEQINLKIKAKYRMEAMFEVIDSGGRTIQNQLQFLENGTNNISYPVSGSAGTYFLRIHTNKGVLSKKIVKVN